MAEEPLLKQIGLVISQSDNAYLESSLNKVLQQSATGEVRNIRMS